MIEGAVLIAGPTASGKSRLALDWARRTGGVIVNADSMQVYAGLRVLTARPGPEDLAAAPHALYGHIDPSVAYSTGQWLRDAGALSKELDGRVPIFVGGTGLYFRALILGLSAMPDIPEHVRTRWRYKLKEEGSARLHRVLMGVDPKAAMSLQASDGQRIVRALEVLDASGRSLLDWQAEKGKPLVDTASVTKLLVTIDRDELRGRINGRFDAMLEGGALEEVRELRMRNLDAALPAMRAIGVSELSAYLDGALTLAEASERAKAATRQYAKRQLTWFRNQLDTNWRAVTSGDAD